MTTMGPVERGHRLRDLRESAGYKQRQVGAWFDIDGRAVSEWERGKSSPDRRKLARLDEMYEAGGEVLAMFDVRPPGDDERHQAERRLLLAIGSAVVAMMDAVELDGIEDLDELRAELQSALRAVQ